MPASGRSETYQGGRRCLRRGPSLHAALSSAASFGTARSPVARTSTVSPHPLVPPRVFDGTRASADDQIDGDVLDAPHALARQAREQALRRAAPDVRRGDANCRKRRRDLGGEIDVVEACDGDAVGHGDAACRAFEQDAEGQEVVAADDCGERIVASDERAKRRAPTPDRKCRFDVAMVGQPQPVRSERFPHPGHALARAIVVLGVARHDGEFAVAEREQVLRR